MAVKGNWAPLDTVGASSVASVSGEGTGTGKAGFSVHGNWGGTGVGSSLSQDSDVGVSVADEGGVVMIGEGVERVCDCRRS